MRVIDRVLSGGLDYMPAFVFGHKIGADFDALADVTDIVERHGGDVAAAVQEVAASEGHQVARSSIARAIAETTSDDVDRLILGNPDTAVFLVDNIAEFIYSHPRLPSLNDFPPVVPARSAAWMEWMDTFMGGERRRVGAMVLSRRNDDDDGWRVGISVYLENGKRVYGPVARLTLDLDGQGRVSHDRWPRDRYGEIGAGGRASAFLIVLQALAFLHCRNVDVESIDPIAPKLARRFRQRHGFLPVEIKTIRLNVPRKGFGGSGSSDTPGHHRLHIVDGHFAHYGSCCDNHPPKGLLFGKYEGVYWVEAHARGNADLGTVVTDRVLVPPTDLTQQVAP